MSSDDTVLLAGRIPTWIKEMVDADPRDNQEILRVALQKEMGGRRQSELEVRLEQLDRRLSVVDQEQDELMEEREGLEQQRARIKSRIEESSDAEEQKLANARDVLEDVPHDPTNPAIENWASDLGMTPDELIEELEDGDQQ